MFTGFYGLATGLMVFGLMWLLAFLRVKAQFLDMDARGEKGAFEKILASYIDLAKFIIGLASGSIVLLVGSSALHSTPRLPDSFASPLFLLALSVLYGILFMVWLTLNYEQYRAHGRYSRFKYGRNLACGFSALLCFCIGYGWLIFVVTR